MAASRIVELASVIQNSTSSIDAHLAQENLPSPSFDAEQPSAVLDNAKIKDARQAILEATDELHSLMLGPAIYHFGFATSFPAGKHEATFAEIATASGVPEPLVQRLLRHAMTNRIFCEPREGIVAHTAASKFLAENKDAREWSDGLIPGIQIIRVTIALIDSQGYNIAHNTNRTIFGEISQDTARENRYGAAMAWFATRPDLQAQYVVDGFDWASLGAGTVVDVGGSYGTLSVAIGRNFPLLHFIVQDQREVVETARQVLPEEMKNRVKFLGHDFFTEQPIKEAQVYLLRWILHDWSDKYAITIIRALARAMGPRSRIVVCEQVMPTPGSISAYQERAMRGLDLAMLEVHNARERSVEDWATLFASADSRLQLQNVRRPEGSRLSFLEVALSEGR
ncbi:hypothetical protein ACLMJK_000352 [Lecanora helva]